MRIARLSLVVCVVCALAIFAQPVHAQQRESMVSKVLTKPEIEYVEPFTRIMGVRELRDGRVIVADAQERSVSMIDFAKQSGTRIGRQGDGPGEYQFPTALYALAGDTTIVSDLGRRFLKISPSGEMLTTSVSLPTPTGGRSMIMAGSGSMGFDWSGKLYAQGPAVQFGDAGPVFSDSAPLTRVDLTRSRTDTLGYVTLSKNKPQVSSAAAGNVSVRTTSTPFEARDVWAVAPDGRVAIVRVADFHIDWISPTGVRTRGAPTPFQQLRVTEDDKKSFRENRGRGMMISGTSTNGGAVQFQMGPPPGGAAAPPAGPEPDWPEFKPPFTSAVMSPSGELWVLRSRAAGSNAALYDVFGVSGRMTAQVLLPEKTTLVGFGAGTVYLVRTDSDDLQYLQRYRM